VDFLPEADTFAASRGYEAMTFGRITMLVVPILAGAAVSPASPQESVPTLILPIDCTFGETCFIQQYFDHDPGPGAKDYRCGPMTYDGHDGVDLRVPTMAAQKKGVTILAAASGIVRGTRDGMDDVSVALVGRDDVKGRECGNGVVIAHADGWETQYCHMAKGSVRVKKGDELAAGAALGLVGMSGDAAFPHLHFSVRHNGEKIDPFAAEAAPGACDGKSLWAREAAAALAYHSPELINSGFASQAITMDDIESGRAGSELPAADSPNLIAFARVIGLKRADVQTLTLHDPTGAVMAKNQIPALVRDRAQQFVFAGQRLHTSGWPRGTYEAAFEVRRDGVSSFVPRFSFTLR
jgi:murein DD-endopeptidase MepM/ murein hydrolase activator NlpD